MRVGDCKSGDVVEICVPVSNPTCKASFKVLYVGKTYSLLEDDKGYEHTVYSRYKCCKYFDKNHQKRNEIIKSWNRTSLDNAHDTEKSMAHIGAFIDMLFAEGFVEVK